MFHHHSVLNFQLTTSSEMTPEVQVRNSEETGRLVPPTSDLKFQLKEPFLVTYKVMNLKNWIVTQTITLKIPAGTCSTGRSLSVETGVRSSDVQTEVGEQLLRASDQDAFREPFLGGSFSHVRLGGGPEVHWFPSLCSSSD